MNLLKRLHAIFSPCAEAPGKSGQEKYEAERRSKPRMIRENDPVWRGQLTQ